MDERPDMAQIRREFFSIETALPGTNEGVSMLSNHPSQDALQRRLTAVGRKLCFQSHGTTVRASTEATGSVSSILVPY